MKVKILNLVNIIIVMPRVPFSKSFKDALIFCADGVGEWCTTSVFIENDKKLNN